MIIFTKIISIPLNRVLNKQKSAKKERDLKIAELKENTNGDQEALTEEIYQYYKNIDYNPIKTFISKAVIVVLNLSILFSVVGVFKPVTNFSELNKEQIKTATTIYQENFDTNSYIEIEMLHNLDKVKPLLEKELSKENIDNLNEVKSKFVVGSLDTTIIPTHSDKGVYICLPVIVLILCVLQQIVVNLNKKEKNELLIGSLMGCISVGITALFVFKTPIIVCLYFLVIDFYSLVLSVFNYIKSKREVKNVKRNK